MDNFDYLFCKARENGKIAEALSEKLQTEVEKDEIIKTINGIDFDSIVLAKLSAMNVTPESITDSSATIDKSKYVSRLDISEASIPNATNIDANAMQYCIALKSVDAPNATSLGTHCFSSGISLKYVNLPSVTDISTYSFFNCETIKNISLPSVTNVGGSAFKFCISLTSLILGANEVVTLGSSLALQGTPIQNGNGYIYVPDNLVEDYKSATNWSVYADQIRPMSECEV